MGSAVTILVSVLGVLGAAALYAWQKVVDRREAHRAELREAYRGYLTSVSRRMSAPFRIGTDAFDEEVRVHDAQVELLNLIAPDAVVRGVTEFELALRAWLLTTFDDESRKGDADLMRAAVDRKTVMLKAIRADLFASSRSTIDLADLVPKGDKP